jgi:hypothetical protein
MRNVVLIRKISNSVIVFAEDMFVRDLLEISFWRGSYGIRGEKKCHRGGILYRDRKAKSPYHRLVRADATYPLAELPCPCLPMNGIYLILITMYRELYTLPSSRLE